METVVIAAYDCVIKKLARTVQANKKRFVELTYLENYINEAGASVSEPKACLEHLKKLNKSLEIYSDEFYVYRMVLMGLKKDIRKLEKGIYPDSTADYLGIG